MTCAEGTKVRFRPSVGTLAALGLLDIKVDAMPTTAYIMLGEKCVRDCAFCAQASGASSGSGKLSRVIWPETDDEALLPALSSATRQGTIKRVCIQTVGGRSSLETVCRAILMLRSACAEGTLLSVSFSATADIDDIGRIISSGADKVALAVDACNPDLHLLLKKSDMARSLSLIKEAAATFPDHISTHLIAGMGETERDLLCLATDLRDMGAGLGLFAFTPIRGTAMESHPRPDMESYRRVQLAFWLIKHHGLKRDEMLFTEDGRLSGLGLTSEELMAKAASGDAFRTSGCTFCNRPYYNESPGTELYNYPCELTREEAREALDKALRRVALAGGREVI